MTDETDAFGAWAVSQLEGVGGREPPAPDLLVAYAEGRLSEEEREALEAHLAESEAGRRLLASLPWDGRMGGAHDASSSAPSGRRRRSVLHFPLLALAAAALVGVGLYIAGVFDPARTPKASSSVLIASAFERAREAHPDLFAGVEPLSAEELAAPGPAGQRGGITLFEPAFVVTGLGGFRWEPVAGARLYRLRVTDEAGKILYEAKTPQAVHIAPEKSLRLFPGQHYIWEVEAKTATAAPTGRRSFQVAEVELSRRYKRSLEVLRAAAGPREARLAEAELAARLGLWPQARLLAKAYLANRPRDALGRALLERIRRQLSIPAEATPGSN